MYKAAPSILIAGLAFFCACASAMTYTTNYHGIQTGDVVKATIHGNGLIIGYVNGVEAIRATDTTYPGGNPEIGFWVQVKRGEGRGTNADYGFSAFTATDGVSSAERK